MGHIQFSPTDPTQLMFCHEGPWTRLQRIWLIRTDGSGLRAVHMRTMDNEQFGHEFWDPSGKKVWYDLQKPMWKSFYIGGTNIETGEEVAYPIKPEHWSYHFNCNADATLFCGDGGAVKHGAGKETSGIYLYTLNKGQLEVTMLCALPDHDYKLEPNVRFSPDEQWVIFRANHQGSNQVYAVATKREK